MGVKRYGMVLGIKPEELEEYSRLHAAVWPEVLARIAECNLCNYSIYHRQLDDGKHYLFSYYEYLGDDYEADMAKLAADPHTQRWWDVCMPMQIPLESRQEGEWWAVMNEVFYFDGDG